jgi:predicted dehydrogenase
MSDPVRVAVIGLGYWGPNLVRNLAELDQAELVAVCDLDPERLALVGRRYPAVRRTFSAADVIAADDVEAVLIATPVSSHHALGVAALSAGKHVFVEKPLATSVREGSELAGLASRRGLILMPGHTFLYSPPVVAIHDLIASGALGHLLFISSSRVNLGLHQPDVSVVWDLAPHDFSILRYWLGETPTHVSATARACIGDLPDVAFIDLEYESGPIAHVELAWLAPSKLRRTTIVGSEKMVVYDDTSNEPVRIFDSGVHLREPETFGEFRLTYRTGDIVSPRIDASEPLSLELRDFCQAIRQGRPPRSSSGVGLEVVRMMEAVDRSLASEGARIDVIQDGVSSEREREAVRSTA